NQIPRVTIESMLAAEQELGLSGEVVYALGKDTQELDRILALPVLRQGPAITRYAAKLQAQVEEQEAAPDAQALKISKQGQAVRPKVGGSVTRSSSELSIDDPNLPIEEFMKRRDADDKARRAAARA